MSDTSIADLCVPPIFVLTPEWYEKRRDPVFVREVLTRCETHDVGEWGGDAINRLLHVHQFNADYRQQTRKHLERLLARYNEE